VRKFQRTAKRSLKGDQEETGINVIIWGQHGKEENIRVSELGQTGFSTFPVLTPQARDSSYLNFSVSIYKMRRVFTLKSCEHTMSLWVEGAQRMTVIIT
jgi:hypothetical protein